MAEEFDLRELSLDRRSFLRRGAMGGAGLALLGTGGMSAFLAACGSSSKPSSSGSTGTTAAGTKDLGELTFQLSWIKNVEFAGEYIADTNGYYKDAGFSKVTLLSGGPTVQQDSVVQGGKALVCISAPDITSAAINQGADLVTIGAQYQKNPFAVMSLATKPINTPDDMIGKKIGVQATNEAVWNAFLKANAIDPCKITKVPVQFDPPPLVAGHGRRLVLVRHERAEPAEDAGRRDEDVPARRLQVPARLGDVRREEGQPHVEARRDQGDARGRHQGLAAEPEGPDHRGQAGRQRLRQGPEAHGRRADARVDVGEPADRRPTTRRRTGSSRSPTR